MLSGILFFLTVGVVSAKLTMAPYSSEVVRLIMQQDYQRAFTITDSIIACNKADLDARYLRLTILQTMVLDYEWYVNDTVFIAAADSFLSLIPKESLVKGATFDIKKTFFAGNVIGGRALVLTKQDQLFTGFSEAQRSLSMLDKVLKTDATYYEAYLGPGVFDYYVGKTFKWVPFVGRREDVGIEKVILATKNNSFFSFAAFHSLLWILIEKGRYAEADRIVRDLLKKYPNNTILLRIKSRIDFFSGARDSAVQHAQLLIDHSIKRTPVNWSDLFSGYEILIRIYEQEKNWDALKPLVEKALSYDVPVKAKKIIYVKENLEYIGVANVRYVTNGVMR